MGGKSGGGMPQQQKPSSPGVGNAGVGKNGGGKFGGGQPQQQGAPPNDMMAKQQGMQRAQMMAQRLQGFQPGAPQPYDLSRGLNAAQATANGNDPTKDPSLPATPAASAAQGIAGLSGQMESGGQMPAYAQPYFQRMMARNQQQRPYQPYSPQAQGGSQQQALNAGYQDFRNQMNYPQQQMQGLASLLGGQGFAEGGPVAQAPIAWTPTGANISPGTPSGPVVWNPNQFGGIAPTGGGAAATGSLAPLAAITAPKIANIGVVKYVAPPAVKKAAEDAKKAVEKYRNRADASSNGIYYPGGGNSAWMEGGRGGSHAGFSGSLGAHGYSGYGGGGPGNIGGGLYSLGGMVR